MEMRRAVHTDLEGVRFLDLSRHVLNSFCNDRVGDGKWSKEGEEQRDVGEPLAVPAVVCFPDGLYRRPQILRGHDADSSQDCGIGWRWGGAGTHMQVDEGRRPQRSLPNWPDS